MCQFHTGAYVSLLTLAGETDHTDCHPGKTTTYILHIVSITAHTHDRRKSIGEKKQRNDTKYKGNKRKEKKAKQNKKRKEKKRKRQEKQEKTRQEEEAKKGKKKKRRKKKKKRWKNVILADPRNWLKTALGSLKVSSASMALGRKRNMAKK